MYDGSQVKQLVARVREAAERSCVLQVSEHFAGYFDELGITILVTPEASDDDIRALNERIAPILLNSRVPFKWILVFKRGGKQAAVLLPDGLFALGC